MTDGAGTATIQEGERAYEKLAELCDHIVMVAQLSRTNRDRVKELAGLLRQRKRNLAELDQLDNTRSE